MEGTGIEGWEVEGGMRALLLWKGKRGKGHRREEKEAQGKDLLERC